MPPRRIGSASMKRNGSKCCSMKKSPVPLLYRAKRPWSKKFHSTRTYVPTSCQASMKWRTWYTTAGVTTAASARAAAAAPGQIGPGRPSGRRPWSIIGPYCRRWCPSNSVWRQVRTDIASFRDSAGRAACIPDPPNRHVLGESFVGREAGPPAALSDSIRRRMGPPRRPCLARGLVGDRPRDGESAGSDHRRAAGHDHDAPERDGGAVDRGLLL